MLGADDDRGRPGGAYISSRGSEIPVMKVPALAHGMACGSTGRRGCARALGDAQPAPDRAWRACRGRRGRRRPPRCARSASAPAPRVDLVPAIHQRMPPAVHHVRAAGLRPSRPRTASGSLQKPQLASVSPRRSCCLRKAHRGLGSRRPSWPRRPATGCRERAGRAPRIRRGRIASRVALGPDFAEVLGRPAMAGLRRLVEDGPSSMGGAAAAFPARLSSEELEVRRHGPMSPPSRHQESCRQRSGEPRSRHH